MIDAGRMNDPGRARLGEEPGKDEEAAEADEADEGVDGATAEVATAFNGGEEGDGTGLDEEDGAGGAGGFEVDTFVCALLCVAVVVVFVFVVVAVDSILIATNERCGTTFVFTSKADSDSVRTTAISAAT